MKKTLAVMLAAILLLAVPAVSLAETMVLFTPWANTSTAEDTKLVEEKLEAMMAEGGLDIDLDWIITPTEGNLEKLNSMLDGSTQLDAVTGNIGDALGYMTQGGIVLPLNDLLNEYGKNLLEKIPEAAWIPCTDSQGNIWCIPDYYQWIWQGAVIRTDLLAECELEMPTTLAELEHVMEVFHEKYPDMVVATGLPWFSDPFLQGSVSGRGSQQTDWALSEDGKVVPSMTLPEYKNMIALYRKWVDNGWLEAEWLSGNDDSQSSMWAQGRCAIYFCDPHRALDWVWGAFRQNNPDATADFIPPLKNEDGVAYYPMGYGVGRVVWVTTLSHHPEIVVQYLDKMISEPDFYYTAMMGIEGTHWVDKGDSWAYPEGIDGNNALYSQVLRPLSWEFLDVLKPMEGTNPESADVHNRLNEAFNQTTPIRTGLEGFTPDGSELGMYNPIDLYEYLFNITIGVGEVDDFDSIVETWYTTGGQELVDAYTAQYQAFAANKAE